ncbi:BTAD domain-containing putative transcriptional regulator [Micromonospora sp. WMMA1363]|uniref:AfsR/SARP family transcriptional regulator n=1 Tax=Micromonospora sp. WMMA1363 TaxID=3053985 RepID=UPI00259D2848|nr:AfsR/SARP family transcriptional regulator [Micromonospora sp. WMMA1363]MDM4718188.1 BTAD domain-containing putative transcriptional regulator [Micromonospora sp. WMMA1363]
MVFRILGPLSVTHEDRDITPTAPKVRQVLAFLLVRRNQVVQVSEFVDELWGDNPPDSAMTTLQTYVYKLRKDVLDPSGLARLHTQSCGYLLDVNDNEIDVYHFERLAQQGRREREHGDAQRASELLTEALALWRAPALLGVNAGEILSAHMTRLEENKLRVLGMRIEADMQLGRYEELISELKELVRSYPLHERFHANLMTALDRSGRRYEAFEVYRRLRELLIDELGLEPSPAVQRLHRSLLNTEPGESRPAPRPTAPAERAPIRTAVPAQLPPDVPDFTGREEVVRRVRAVLAAGQDQRTAPAAVSICGMTGVGKTTLALHVGHLERARYPHGQLFADLRGSSRTPTPQLDVLAGFLRALCVPEQQIPPTVEERSSLYRTWTNGRRLLVVLDDAATASQIAPLVPATPESAVVVTSRWGLQVLPGIQVTKLDVMTIGEAVALLGAMVGASRVDAEPGEAERIADRCGYLPLALRCVGARLAAAPTWPLRKITALIEHGPAALDQLRFAEFDVRTNYDETYYRLEPHDRSALRLLSLLPPPHFTAATAANLLGGAADAVETQLSRLVACNLLEARADQGVVRYQLHRLTRLYARERLNHEFIEPRLGSNA